MSLEQAIAENTAVLISIRDLIISGKLNIIQGTEVEKKETTTPTDVQTEPEQIQETHEAPTEREVIESFIELATSKRDAAVSVLSQFSVLKAVDVPENRRKEFLRAVKDKLAEIDGV